MGRRSRLLDPLTGPAEGNTRRFVFVRWEEIRTHSDWPRFLSGGGKDQFKPLAVYKKDRQSCRFSKKEANALV